MMNRLVAGVNGDIIWMRLGNRTDVNDKTGYLVVWNVGDELKSVSFDNVTYIADEMALVRRVKPEGSGM